MLKTLVTKLWSKIELYWPQNFWIMLYLSQIFPHSDASVSSSFSIPIKTYNYFCLVKIKNNGYFLEFISAVYITRICVKRKWTISVDQVRFISSLQYRKTVNRNSIFENLLKICIAIKSYFRRSKFIYSYSNNTQGPELSWMRQHLLTLYA